MTRRLSSLLRVLALALAAAQAFAQPADDLFIAARDAARAGDLKKLDALAPQLDGHPLQAYVDYWRLSGWLADVDPYELRAFFSKYPDSPLVDRLRADWLRQLGNAGAWDTFTAEFAKLPQPDTELVCFNLQARLARGDSKALPAARPLWLTGALQPDGCGPVFEQAIAAGEITGHDLWARLRLALEANNLPLARRINLLPADGQLFRQKTLDAAADNPLRHLNGRLELESRAGRELAIYALLRVARNDPAEAVTRFEAIAERFPEADRNYVWAQLATRAMLELQPQALALFSRVSLAKLSDAQLGWLVRAALRVQDWNEVLKTIAAMSESEQRDSAWRYWKARALKASGNAAEATEIFTPLARELHFYGLLAAEELGQAVTFPPAWTPTDKDMTAIGEVAGLQRALLLNRFDLRSEAIREWIGALRGSDDQRLLAAAELARRAGWTERAINTADRTRELHDYAQRYPTPYRDAYLAQAKAYDLDPAWVYGISRQESRFTPDIRSRAGALGLMQVMPATGRWIAKRLGDKGFREADLTAIETNIAYGVYYLRYALDSLGHPLLATAGYNAGPNRAKRWRGAATLEGAIYVETIPINETRDYVKKVMTNASLYAELLGQKRTAFKERLGMIAGLGADANAAALAPETARAPDFTAARAMRTRGAGMPAGSRRYRAQSSAILMKYPGSRLYH